VYDLTAFTATDAVIYKGPVLDFSKRFSPMESGMQYKSWTSTIAVLFLLSAPAIAQESGKVDRLFRSNDILEITITGPIETLMDERPIDEDLPGMLSYIDDTGATVELEVGLRTRGNYRRQERICPFAPIRLNFKKGDTKESLFHKQDKIKLVTHCRNSSKRYQQVVLKEYLSYRFLNTLTDFSYRVRLLQITYVDPDNPRDQQTRYGFLIEHRDRLAKRIDLPHVVVKKTNVASLHGEYTNLISLFHYFIANTDFSPIAGASDDDCCHNTTLFGKEGELLYPIPYDFDMAGMTDAPYATPNVKLNLRNVRERRYRGRCENNQHLPTSVRVFNDNRQTLRSLVENMDELSGSPRTSMYFFIDRFYKIFNDPNGVRKKLENNCI
jgi:hypothetical protein